MLLSISPHPNKSAPRLATHRVKIRTSRGKGQSRLAICQAVRQTWLHHPAHAGCTRESLIPIRRESGLFMETPQIRPGLVKEVETTARVVVFFPNSALGNLAIQLLMQIGIPNDHMGVVPPEQIEGKQGMVLSIGCPDEKSLARVESICRSQGGRIHRQGY